MSVLHRVRRAAFERLVHAPSWVRAIAPKAPRIQGQALDPDLWWVCWLTARLETKNPSPARLRADYRLACEVLDGPVRDDVAWRDDCVPRRDGGTVPIRVYSPKSRAEKPGIVYFHGGGNVIGDLDSHHAACVRLAHDADAVVIAVDYRLAPEHAFPAPWDDAEDAWRAISAGPGTYGIVGRLAVGGDSAGANIAIWIARTERVAPGHLWAVYPPTDAGGTHPSHRHFSAGLMLSNARKRWFGDRIYPNAEQRLDPRAQPLHAPARRSDGSAVSSTVVVAGMDVLRDEGEAYIAHLRTAGVPVTGLVIPNQVHGFVTLTAVGSCLAAWELAVGPLREALHG